MTRNGMFAMKQAVAVCGSRRRMLLLAALLMGAALLVMQGLVPVAEAQACCQVTAVSGKSASAVDTKTKTTFQFTLTKSVSLRVGDAVYANFPKKEVSCDGKSICGTITSITPGAATTTTGGPLAVHPTQIAVVPPLASANQAPTGSTVGTLAPVPITPGAARTPITPKTEGTTEGEVRTAPATLAPKAEPTALGCRITAINTNTGEVSARESATGRTFTFAVSDASLLNSIKVGQGVHANFGAKEVSLDGKVACCAIVQLPSSGSTSSPNPTLRGAIAPNLISACNLGLGCMLQSLLIGAEATSQATQQTMVLGGASTQGTVTTNSAPASPNTPFIVNLSSSNPKVLFVQSPIELTTNTAPFGIGTQPVATDTAVVITASFNGKSLQQTLIVTPPTPKAVTLSPSSVAGGNPSQGTVTVYGTAPTGGINVSLSSSNPAVAGVPASVHVGAGSNTATFSVSTSQVSNSTSATISALYSSQSCEQAGLCKKSALLTVQIPGTVQLHIVSVTIYDSAGNQLQAPIAGETFQMCIAVANGGNSTLPASTLTVQETSSDNSYSNSWSQAVPQLAAGAGYVTNPCISPPALNSDVTYDFNIYDPSSTFLGDFAYSP